VLAPVERQLVAKVIGLYLPDAAGHEAGPGAGTQQRH